MSKAIRVRIPSILLALSAGAFLAVALKMPLWHMRMEAPQYRDEEALQVHVYPRAMRGDLGEIGVLNQYIGVHIPTSLPQLKWLPLVMIACALLGLAAVALPTSARRRSMLAVGAALALALVAAAGLAQWQMYRVGHDRDPHTVLKGVPDFTPPIIGRVKVANFEISSRIGLGGYLTVVAIVLYAAAGMRGREGRRSAFRSSAGAADTNPKPLHVLA